MSVTSPQARGIGPVMAAIVNPHFRAGDAAVSFGGMPVSRVLVVGAGVSGCVAAVALRQRGVDVDLVEISPYGRTEGSGITLQGNALRAFAAIGVAGEVIARGRPFDMLRMRNADGSLILEQPTERTGGPDLPATVGTLRGTLREILEAAVTAAGVTVRYGVTLDGVRDTPTGADVRLSDGTGGRYDLVVGADGIRSATRALVGVPDRPRPTGMAIWRMEGARPAAMDCAELYYGGPAFKAGYTPVSATRMYAYVLVEPVPPGDLAGRDLTAMMRDHVGGYGGLWPEIRGSITADTPVNYQLLESLLVPPPWHRGRVLLIGDAVHACPPLLAQGAAMCAEDAVVLAECVGSGAPVGTVLDAFVTRRYERVRLVVDGSLCLTEWEMHPETPGSDPAGLMAETSRLLARPA